LPKTQQAAPREKRYLTTNQLRERWGNVSHMFIARRIYVDPLFPKAKRFNGRTRFWDEQDIEKYEQACVRRDEKITALKKGAA
jgi:hypothetical protein